MDRDIDIRGIFGTLKRRFLVVVLAVVLCVAAAALALLSLQPVYTATTLVLVDPSNKDLLDPNAAASSYYSDASRVDSEVEIVRSDTTLLRVIQDMDLVNDPEFGVSLSLTDRVLAFFGLASPNAPSGDAILQGLLKNLQQSISVQRRGLTSLIAIQAKSGNPDLAARLANTTASAYIAEQLGSKVQSLESARSIIEARIAEASRAVTQSEQSFDTFIDTNLQRISEETGRTDLLALRDSIDAAIRQRTADATSVERAGAALSRRDWAAVATELKDSALQALEQQRSDLQARFASATDQTTQVNLREQLASLETSLEQSAAQALQNNRTALTDAQTRIGDLRTQLRTDLLNSDLPAGTLASLYELQQTAEINRRQYQTLLSRQSDLETQAFLQIADSRIVSEAVPPSEPSFPSTRMMLALGALAGLGLGIGLALLIENFIGGFTEEGQIEGVLKIPTLASLPVQKSAGDRRPDAPADAVALAPMSVFAEGLRRVRLGVDHALRVASRANVANVANGVVVLVTSTVPGEGKTSVALSLARSYALSGKPTLLIDCDLRKPSLHRYLGLEPSSGLVDLLSDADAAPNVKDIVTVDELSGLRCLAGGRASDRPTDQLLASAAFRKLVASARRTFQYVIIDTPPTGLVIDALEVGTHSDMALFVVKWASTSQQDVKSAIADIQATLPEMPIRIVLNQKRDVKLSKYDAYYAN